MGGKNERGGRERREGRKKMRKVEGKGGRGEKKMREVEERNGGAGRGEAEQGGENDTSNLV